MKPFTTYIHVVLIRGVNSQIHTIYVNLHINNILNNSVNKICFINNLWISAAYEMLINYDYIKNK